MKLQRNGTVSTRLSLKIISKNEDEMVTSSLSMPRRHMQGESRGMAPLILQLGTGWGRALTTLAPLKETWSPLKQEVGRFGESENVSLPPWSSSPQDCHYNDWDTVAATGNSMEQSSQNLWVFFIMCVRWNTQWKSNVYIYLYIGCTHPCIISVSTAWNILINRWYLKQKKPNMESFWIWIK